MYEHGWRNQYGFRQSDGTVELIDFINKYSNADGKFIEGFLLNIKLKKEMIDLFIQKMCGYNERIEIFKNAMFEKNN